MGSPRLEPTTRLKPIPPRLVPSSRAGSARLGRLLPTARRVLRQPPPPSDRLTVAQLVERRTVKLMGFGPMRISLGRWFESAR